MSRSPRLQVPRENGAYLAHPPFEQIGELISENRRRLSCIPGDLLGRPWQELQSLARREVIEAARRYLEDNGQPPPRVPSDRIVMTGHQPELIHPGVWVKNFALYGIAAEHGCAPLHLIVDNDVIKANALRVPPATNPLPAIDDFVARCASVYFSESLLGVPYEEGNVTNEELFASVPARVTQSRSFEPMLKSFWARATARSSSNLGERFAFARRSLEREWGCHNLEARVSDVCRSEAFAWHACHLLVQLSRFHKAHNDSLASRRREHGVTIADLQRDGEWLEAPFWACGARQRQRLWARREQTGIRLRAGDDEWPTLPWDEHCDAAKLVQTFRALGSQRRKIRPRALTNTIFHRLLVADLFVHGIGGGRYDEVTDEILRRFYSVEPPRFVIMTGTLRLPLPRYPNDSDDAQRLKSRLRDFHWNPQRHLLAAGADPITNDLARQKEDWILRSARTASERRRRWQALRSLTTQLQAAVAAQRLRIETLLETYRKRQQANALLQRRDFAICLYPEAALREFCALCLRSEPIESDNRAPEVHLS